MALHHDERHVVLNALGTADMRIDVGPQLRLDARDTLLLASDGLFDNLYTEEIVECIRKGPLTDAAVQLMTHCRTRMQQPGENEPSHPDDTTYVIFRRH